MDRIVVIIPALNAALTLPRQLRALDAQTDLDFRVVISDNGSTDDTAQVAKDWEPRFESIEVVDSSQRRGVANARNAAIRATGEELILICDADDRAHPGWVSAMRSGLRVADAVTGPLVAVYSDGRRETWNDTQVPTSMGYLRYAPGGNIGIRRTVFDAMGGFRADMTLGQEDVDFGWRMVNAGFTISHQPGAAVDYYQRAGWRPLLRQQWRYGRAHVQLYLRHREEPIRVASWKTSARWFVEWARQLPRRLRAGEASGAAGAAVFQLARCVESVRYRTATPL